MIRYFKYFSRCFLIWALLLPSVVFASEIDSITDRCEPLPDLTVHLNIIVSDGLNKVVNKANKKAKKRYLRTSYPFRMKLGRDYCNPDDVYKYLRKMFARVLIGQLESYINKLPETIVRKTPFEKSIYQDLRFIETPTLAGMKKMGSIIRIGDYVVGADKFGHFFAEGWTCFQYAYLFNRKSIDAALDYSQFSESFYYGASTTGVYSNADIAVNFNGLRFYNAITGAGDDPLGPEQRPAPYLKCVKKKWQLFRQFDWNEYIDGAWDEGVNPNLYRNEIILEKVKARMDESLADYPDDCDCKLTDENQIEQLRVKYGRYADVFINSNGPGVRPEALKAGTLLKALLTNPQ